MAKEILTDRELPLGGRTVAEGAFWRRAAMVAWFSARCPRRDTAPPRWPGCGRAH